MSDPVKAVWGALPPELLSKFYIDGGWHNPTSGTRIEIVSPVTERPVLNVPGGGINDIDTAIAAARQAFDEGSWPRMTFRQRGAILGKIAAELRALGDLPSCLYTAQVGAPISFARMTVGAGADAFEYYAGLAGTLSASEERSVAHGQATVRTEPGGVAAIITPWNAPLALFSLSVAAALLAGCTVVSKPAPETPLDALLVGWCASRAGLPPGVLNIVPADRDAGTHMIRDTRIDKISFTGSTEAGRFVAQAGAERAVRVTLELGGKSAAIILPDADIDAALQHIVPWSMPFSGQICFSLTRLLVPEERAQEITDAYVEAVRGIALGDPWDPATQMGPVVSARQFNRVNRYIELGSSQGARLLTGGRKPAGFDRGYFIEPTVFDAVHPDMTIAREEIFGPVVSVIRYRDEEDAIRIANATPYGLSGAIFGADAARAMDVALQVRSGAVSVNTMNYQVAVPNGGVKQSGIGRVGGVEGLQAYQESKTIYS